LEDAKGSGFSLLAVKTPVIFLEEAANTTEILSEDDQCPGRDTNLIAN